MDEIDFGERLIVSRLLNIEDGNDVLVVEVSEELHFSEGSETEHGVVKGGDLLNGDLLSRGFVECRTKHKISDFDQPDVPSSLLPCPLLSQFGLLLTKRSSCCILRG